MVACKARWRGGPMRFGTRSKLRTRLHQVLAVVQDEQHLLAADVFGQHAGQVLRPVVAKSYGRGDGGRHEHRVLECRELDHPTTVRKTLLVTTCKFLGQTGFANSPRADKRQ